MFIIHVVRVHACVCVHVWTCVCIHTQAWTVPTFTQLELKLIPKRRLLNICLTLFRRVRKIAKSDNQLRHVCLSVCLSARNNSDPTGRIFMKFDIWVIFEKSVKNSSFVKIWQEQPVLYTHIHIPFNSSSKREMLRRKLYRKSKYTFHVQ